jgi:hypothetical protein
VGRKTHFVTSKQHKAREFCELLRVMVHGGKLCATASRCGQHNLIVTCGHVCSVATTSESNIDIDLHSDCTPCMGRGLRCILHYIIYIHIKFILNSKTHEGQNVKKNSGIQ